MKNPVLAGFLSLILPGLGQLYVDKDGSGEKFAIPFVLLFAIAVISSGASLTEDNIGTILGTIAIPIIWILSIIHAVMSSIRVNQSH